MIQSTQVLWLVRHGESTWNTLGLAQGHCDQARLTQLGQRQAWAVAAQLRDRPVAALYARDLRGIPVERMRWEPLSNGCILRSPADWPHPVASSDPDEPDPDVPDPDEKE